MNKRKGSSGSGEEAREEWVCFFLEGLFIFTK